jgi:hypothetical protein
MNVAPGPPEKLPSPALVVVVTGMMRSAGSVAGASAAGVAVTAGTPGAAAPSGAASGAGVSATVTVTDSSSAVCVAGISNSLVRTRSGRDAVNVAFGAALDVAFAGKEMLRRCEALGDATAVSVVGTVCVNGVLALLVAGTDFDVDAVLGSDGVGVFAAVIARETDPVAVSDIDEPCVGLAVSRRLGDNVTTRVALALRVALGDAWVVRDTVASTVADTDGANTAVAVATEDAERDATAEPVCVPPDVAETVAAAVVDAVGAMMAVCVAGMDAVRVRSALAVVAGELVGETAVDADGEAARLDEIVRPTDCVELPG